MILECITDRQTDETRERGSGPNDIISLECKMDCRGQIIISVGVGVLAGALILAVGRWGLRYMVVDNLHINIVVIVCLVRSKICII